MPKAILALRSYPFAILMAVMLFLCTLILATSTIGIIGGGGGDDGSGMGGTGKSGLPGDSGFGGTGGPSPFLGDADQNEGQNQDNGEQNPDEWPAPWLPRETETARIPEEIAPLIELQRNPLRDPTRNQTPLFPDNPDALRILEQDTSSLPSHLRQQLDLANSGESFTEEPALEIRVNVPEVKIPAPDESPVILRQWQNPQTASQDVQTTPEATTAPAAELATESGNGTDVQDGGVRALAGHVEEEIPEIVSETPQQTDPRSSAERIQRPELPPFQRMRPAVDRASVLPARPQPMRI